MSGDSKIEWTNATWNPLTGCTLVSEGCRNCYAAREAAGRLSHHPAYAGLAVKRGGRPVFTGEIRLHEDRLDQPLRWRKPRRVFVNSMSDLFHPNVPDEFIWRVFMVMADAQRHTFQILTKRPERMAAFLQRVTETDVLRDGSWMGANLDGERGPGRNIAAWSDWPLRNVWLGTSVEDQATADERIPHLLDTPAAVRFLSCEPLLGPVQIARWLPCPHGGPDGCPNVPDTCCQCDAGRPSNAAIHWVIVGGESGPDARPMHPDWARSLRDQCVEAGVAFFFKQWGEWVEIDGPRCRRIVNEKRASDRWMRRDGTLRPYRGGAMGRESPYFTSLLRRVGKKAAGSQLDGREWTQEPDVTRIAVERSQ